MATAGDIASQALKEILVEGGDAPPEASEYADFLDSLNNYMASLEADNIRLGYTSVSNVSDTVTVPSNAIRGIVSNMALEVAPQYGGRVTPALIAKATDGLRQLRNIGRVRFQTSLPRNLPIGSGNNVSADGYVDPFSRAVLKAFLTLSGNTDTTTPDSRVKGVWDVPISEGAGGDITGRITNSSEYTVTATYKASVSAIASAAQTMEFHLYKNGYAVSGASVSLSLGTTTPVAGTITASIELRPGDYVEIYAVDPASTGETTTVTSASLEAS